MIDQYSKYPVVEVVKTQPMLENAMGLLGKVEMLISDGGPPNDSREFKRFARRMGFRHHI